MTERNAENKSRVAVNVPERMTVSDAPVEDDNFAALRQLKKATAGEEEASDANTLSSCEVPNSFGSGQPPPTKKRKILHETNIDEFKAHMRAKQKAATEIENVEDTVQLGVGERDEWRVRYYKQKFNPTDEDLERKLILFINSRVFCSVNFDFSFPYFCFIDISQILMYLLDVLQLLMLKVLVGYCIIIIKVFAVGIGSIHFIMLRSLLILQNMDWKNM